MFEKVIPYHVSNPFMILKGHVLLLHFAFSVTLIVVWQSHAQAQTIVRNDNLSFSFMSPTVLRFNLYQDVAAKDITYVYFNWNGTSLSLNDIVLDEGSDWYFVRPGDVFTRTTIAANTFSPLVTFGPISYPPVNVGSGDFYLGINTGQGLNVPKDRTVFGWAHFSRNSGSLTMVENVISYNSPGIIVGTTTIVPEPSTWVAGLTIIMILLRSGNGLRKRMLERESVPI